MHLISTRFTFIKNRLYDYNFFMVDVDGRLGGLSLLWRKEIDVEILDSSMHFINFLFKGGMEGVQ